MAPGGPGSTQDRERRHHPAQEEIASLQWRPGAQRSSKSPTASMAKTGSTPKTSRTQQPKVGCSQRTPYLAPQRRLIWAGWDVDFPSRMVITQLL